MQHGLVRPQLQVDEVVDVVAVFRRVQRGLPGALAPGDRVHPWNGRCPKAKSKHRYGINNIDGSSSDADGSSSDAAPATPVTKEEAQEVPVAAGPFKRDKGAADGGLLHDKMSFVRGSYKDLVDERQQLMDRSEFEFEQLDIMRKAKRVYHGGGRGRREH